MSRLIRLDFKRKKKKKSRTLNILIACYDELLKFFASYDCQASVTDNDDDKSLNTFKKVTSSVFIPVKKPPISNQNANERSKKLFDKIRFFFASISKTSCLTFAQTHANSQ
jgi:hypothetical protein